MMADLETRNIYQHLTMPASRMYEVIEQEGHFVNLPPDPRLRTHVVLDLGFNDAMSVIMVQRQMSELRIIDYLEDSHRTLDSYSAELKDKRYNWGKLWLPHDGWNETLAAHGASIADLFRKLGWQVAPVPKAPIEEGIKGARIAMRRTYFDKTKAARLIECLKRYRRNVPTSTGEPSVPIHDEYSHGADAFRYLAMVADKFSNEDTALRGPIAYQPTGIV
jgi:phage terminase large subunit